MSENNSLNLKIQQTIESVEEYKFEPIKGYPMLHWKGKRPFSSTQYYPAQLKETHGEEVYNWINKIFWGDNLQVMSHLLKEFRGQVDLIYIDPPYDSKADYKKKIELKGKKIENDRTSFEEKQYTDIWTNDEYLQYMYERLILLKELLSNNGTVMLHCDWHKVHLLRCIMDEIFGSKNFINEIVWCYEDIGSRAVDYFKRKHDNILMYSKGSERTFNILRKSLADSTIKRFGSYFIDGKITYAWLKENNPGVFKKLKGIPDNLNDAWLDINNGQPLPDWWIDISPLKSHFSESLEYPTQKPEALIERIIKACTNPNDVVFDCFMGSGTTQAVAMKLGRKFIGADINLGAIQTTTKRLINIANDLNGKIQGETKYTGFQVYNVNHYDVFRNPLEAKDLLIKALEIQPVPNNSLYDGEKDGRMVKIMPINRIATKADLNELITNFDYKKLEKLSETNPNKPVESILLVCMGHEPDLAAELQNAVPFKLDIEVVDILRDKANLEFKRDAEAEIVIEGGKLLIGEFYPMNLLQKLSLMKENVDNWKELTDSIMIDFNYDEGVFTPQIVDVPEGNNLVKGVYQIPANAGTIRVKITDLLSESIEITVKIN
jgi:DNA modification methylase